MIAVAGFNLYHDQQSTSARHEIGNDMNDMERMRRMMADASSPSDRPELYKAKIKADLSGGKWGFDGPVALKGVRIVWHRRAHSLGSATHVHDALPLHGRRRWLRARW